MKKEGSGNSRDIQVFYLNNIHKKMDGTGAKKSFPAEQKTKQKLKSSI